VTFKQLEERILKAIQDKALLDEIGKAAADNIKLRTRLGKAAATKGGKAEKLKPLSERYIAKRKEMKAKGDLYSETTPSKSNLTKTGAMLNSLQHKVTGASVEVTVDPDQREKVKGNARLGRTFLNVTNLDLKEFKTKVILHIKKALGS
jgi:hypothetical protein